MVLYSAGAVRPTSRCICAPKLDSLWVPSQHRERAIELLLSPWAGLNFSLYGPSALPACLTSAHSRNTRLAERIVACYNECSIYCCRIKDSHIDYAGIEPRARNMSVPRKLPQHDASVMRRGAVDRQLLVCSRRTPVATVLRRFNTAPGFEHISAAVYL
jgi:hypothetical protein